MRNSSKIVLQALSVAALTVFITPYSFAAPTCASLTNISHAEILPDDPPWPGVDPNPHPVYVYAAYGNISSSSFLINITNYSEYITAALAGEPIGGVVVPFCVAALRTDGAPSPSWTFDDYSFLADRQADFEITTTNAHTGTAITMPLSTGTYSLTAKNTYCTCGVYPDSTDTPIGTPITCSSSEAGANPTININTPQLLTLNNYVQGSSFGMCTDDVGVGVGPGAIIFNFYAPAGTIPPVGQYQTDFSLGVLPRNES